MNNPKTYQNIFVDNVIYSPNDPDKNLLEMMIPIGNLTPKDVIKVYSTDYKYRMLETMQANYEALWMVLGDEQFEEIVFEFIQESPSKEYDLNLYGLEFPIFLQSKKELLEEMPFLNDLANFEIAFWKIFHSPNPPVCNRTEYSNERILNSFFRADASMALVKFDFNIFPLFKFKDKTLEDFFEQYEPEIINNPAYYLLYKENGKVNCQTLSQAQFQFFSEINEKKSLLDVINQTQEITQEEIVDIFKLISTSFLHNLKED